ANGAELQASIGYGFTVQAKFKNQRGNAANTPKCKCCEYRQFWKRLTVQTRARSYSDEKKKMVLAAGKKWTDILKGMPDSDFIEDAETTSGRKAGYRTDDNISTDNTPIPMTEKWAAHSIYLTRPGTASMYLNRTN